MSKKESWIKRNESLITSILSFSALLVSIYVILDQKKIAKENIELIKQQLDLAKAQFDTANTDRREQSVKQKREEIEIQKRIRYQDGLTTAQLNLALKQLKDQQVFNSTAIKSNEPIFSLDSVQISDDSTFYISISNKGRRILQATVMELIVLNKQYNFFSCDTSSVSYNLYPNENQNFEFDKKYENKILHSSGTLAILKVKYLDIVSKDVTFFRIGFRWWGQFDTNKSLTTLVSKDSKELLIFEKMFKTKNWGSYEF